MTRSSVARGDSGGPISALRPTPEPNSATNRRAPRPPCCTMVEGRSGIARPTYSEGFRNLYLSGLTHRDRLFDVAMRWLADRPEPDDGRVLTEIFAFERAITAPTVRRFVADLCTGLPARRPLPRTHHQQGRAARGDRRRRRPPDVAGRRAHRLVPPAAGGVLPAHPGAHEHRHPSQRTAGGRHPAQADPPHRRQGVAPGRRPALRRGCRGGRGARRQPAARRRDGHHQ